MASPHEAPPRARQLRRLPDDGHIAGVCAGVADYFAIDPVIVRIAAVVLAVTGPGVIAYVLAWIFVPEADETDRPGGGHGLHGHNPLGHLSSDRHERGGQIFGIVLLAVAVSILWGGWWSPVRRWMFPAILIGLGLWLILRRRDDGAPTDAAPGGGPDGYGGGAEAAPGGSDLYGGHGSGGAAGAPGGEGGGAGGDRSPGTGLAPWSPPAGASGLVVGAGQPTAGHLGGQAVDDDRIDVGFEPDGGDDDTHVLSGAAGGGGPDGPASPPPPWGIGPWATGPAGPPPEPPEVVEARLAARRRRRMVFPVVMGALAVWTGLAFLTGVSLQSGLAIALCIVGVGFVLGAFVGGSKLLILPALLLGGALVATSVVDVPLRGPVGQRTWAPEVLSELEGTYELSIGEGRLDLTGLRFDPDEAVEVRATVGIGHLVVVLPEGVAADVRARSGVGETMLDDRSDYGVGVSSDRIVGDPDADIVIDLDLHVGLGQVEVVIDGGEPARTVPTTAPEPTGAPDPTAAPDPTTPSTLG